MSEETAEDRAVTMGWVPKEEWKGDPEKWRPADEYVSRGENILPIVKDQLKKAKADLEMALKINQNEINQIKADAYAKAKAEHEEKLRNLDAAELEAFQAGDAETYQKVKAAKANTRPPAPPVPVQGPVSNPVFDSWRDKNDWYQSDPELTKYADFLGGEIVKESPGKPLAEIYEAVTERIKKARPDKFTNPRRDEPGAVEGGTPTGGNKRGGKFADIPRDAQQQYERLAKNFEAKGRKFTKEQYAAEYFAG